MKKVLGFGILALALSACGGGGGSDSSSDGSSNGNNNGGGGSTVNADVMGLYTGSTNQGQSVIGLVDKNNKFWFLYSPSYSNGITGFITGGLTVSGNTVKATNGRDFNFGGAEVYATTLNGTVDAKKSLKGTISYSPSNQVVFDTVYDLTMNKAVANLSTIAGNYRGESAIVQGIENASLTITTTGIVSGVSSSGCTFTGKATPEENTPYYNVRLVFGYSPCYLAGQEVNGVAYYDATEHALYTVAETNNRTNAVLFLGSKSLPK
jgi:hypothetical protein